MTENDAYSVIIQQEYVYKKHFKIDIGRKGGGGSLCVSLFLIIFITQCFRVTESSAKSKNYIFVS